MEIQEFKLEKWLNPRDDAKYNLGASCVKAMTVAEMFEVVGEDADKFLAEIKTTSLHYGYFFGYGRLLEALSKMYKGVTADMILTSHGGTGANNMVVTELLDRGDNVIVLFPNYQQHYSAPLSMGIEVRFLELKEENGYQPDLDELRKLTDKNTKMISFTNPNNPTGAFMEEDMLRGICEIANSVGAYVLSDEIYRGLREGYMPSIVDVYDKGIVTSSTSKVFSMAGTRVGWIVTKDKVAYDRLLNRRSYDTVSGGVFDEMIAAIAFEHYEKILERSRKLVGETKGFFYDWLKTQSKLSCNYDSIGTTAFIKYDYDISAEELCNDIYEKKGVLLCHGGCFEVPKSFRLGYGFGNPEMVKDGLEALGKYFDELNKR